MTTTEAQALAAERVREAHEAYRRATGELQEALVQELEADLRAEGFTALRDAHFWCDDHEVGLLGARAAQRGGEWEDFDPRVTSALLENYKLPKTDFFTELSLEEALAVAQEEHPEWELPTHGLRTPFGEVVLPLTVPGKWGLVTAQNQVLLVPDDSFLKQGTRFADLKHQALGELAVTREQLLEERPGRRVGDGGSIWVVFEEEGDSFVVDKLSGRRDDSNVRVRAGVVIAAVTARVAAL